MRIRTWSSLIATLAGLSVTYARASPDDAPRSEASMGLEEVTVTARRKEENQQDVPLAVTAVSGDYLQENSIVSLHDLSGRVPGLNIDNYNSPVYTNVAIRGQRSSNVAPGQDPAVGYYFNDVSYSYPIGINEQLFDLQSLEVVKGPQGTLFGRNTTGGAVVVRAAKPTMEFGGSVLAGFTGFDHGVGYYTTDVLNLPVNEVFQFRAAFNLVNHDGYVKNLIAADRLASFETTPYTGSSNANPNDEDSKAWRLTAVVHPLESLESYFLYQGSNYHDRGVAYSLTAMDPLGFANFALGGAGTTILAQRQAQQADDFWTTQSGMNAFNRSRNHAASNTTIWSPGPAFTLKNIIGYRHFDQAQAVPLDGVPYQILDVTIDDAGHEFSEELQAQGRVGDDLFNWVAGLYYADQHIDHPRSTNTLPQFGVPISHAEQVANNASYAEYAQGNLKIPRVDGLALTAGIRNTRDVRKMTTVAWNDPAEVSCGLGNAAGCELFGNVTYKVVTYNVSLEYKLDSNTLLYVTRRKGYRAGGWNYAAGDEPSFGPFKPEFVNDWEGGLKRDWHFGEALLRSNLAVYRSRLTNAQKFVSPVSNPNDFAVVNAADATINGGELELTFLPVRSLELSGFVSFLDAKFDDFVYGGNDFTHNHFAQTPKTQYSVRGRYNLPFPQTLGELFLQADYTHQSRVYFSDTAQGATQGPIESQSQAPYGILNLRLDWNSILQSQVNVGVYVRNATATQYDSFGVVLYPSLGYNVATIGAPRIFGAEILYHF